MSHTIRNIVLLCILSFVALYMCSCRPHGILSSRKMREVMLDLHKTDALLQVSKIQHGHSEAKDMYYAMVLEQHGVTQAEFDSSLVWYTAHPQLFDKIYPKVLKQLETERDRFNEVHAAELNLSPETIKEAKALALTPEQLDSMLWVNLHGYPNQWNPLMHDTEDKFLPQIPFLR